MQSHMAKDVNKPSVIAFELTRACPMACRHCRMPPGPDLDKDMDTAECKKVLKAVADYSKCILILTGGEPLTRPDLLELVETGAGYGLRMVMATCGYSMDKQMAQGLRSAGLSAIAFSIDGPHSQLHDQIRGVQGAFDTTMRAIEIAKEAGITFQINTTITKVNHRYIRQIADLAAKLGAACYNPFVLVPTGRARLMADELLDPIEYENVLVELARIADEGKLRIRVTCGPQFMRISKARSTGAAASAHGCMGGIGFGFISHNGNVQPCGFLPVSAGRLPESGYDLAKIWEQSGLFVQLRDRKAITGPCGVCDMLCVCSGCRARAYAAYGDYMASDPICMKARSARV